jgi:lipopolysaccharide export system permease protein
MDQYLVRELIVPFLIGTVAVVLMFQANTYIGLAKTLNLEGVPLKLVFQFIYFQTPSYINLTLCVGMALGSSLAMSRLARESELTALRASGVRIMRVVAPVMACGIAVAFLNYYVAEKIMPPMTKKANQIGFQIGALGITPDLKSNMVVPLKEFTAVFGLVRKKGSEELEFDDAWLFNHPTEGQEQVYYSKGGRYKDGIWTFRDTYIRRFKGLDVTAATATTMTINQRMITESLFSPPVPEELTADDLRERIALEQRVHQDSKQTEVKYLTRFSVPAACIVFALVGPIFAIYFARSGGFTGVLLSIVMVIFYYNAYVVSTEILSKLPFVSPWVAAWLPNLLFLLVGIVAIRRLE